MASRKAETEMLGSGVSKGRAKSAVVGTNTDLAESKGLTTITGHHKCVHVLVESSPKCTTVFIPGNTSELKPGNSDIEVVVVNKSR